MQIPVGLDGYHQIKAIMPIPYGKAQAFATKSQITNAIFFNQASGSYIGRSQQPIYFKAAAHNSPQNRRLLIFYL